MLQVSFKKKRVRGKVPTAAALSELPEGEHGILDHVDLPHEEAVRLMELGFLPGARVAAVRRAPGGGPRVYAVDGSEFAMRHDTAARLKLRPHSPVPEVL